MSSSTFVRVGRQATNDSLPKDWQATTQLSHALWLEKAEGKVLFSVKEKEMWLSPL
jgi:hypothetical protein